MSMSITWRKRFIPPPDEQTSTPPGPHKTVSRGSGKTAALPLTSPKDSHIAATATAKSSAGSFELKLWTISLFTKLLLLPAYRSTDFEVHRNWLAITHSLPLGEWYYEATSEWTLDYPPFFAYFEFAWSQAARLFDRDMLRVDNLNYANPETVLFQRLSVILSEIVYLWGVVRIFKHVPSPLHRRILQSIAFLLPGLYIVDHVHFQYNGFLFGIQLLSVAAMVEGRVLESGLWFAILLNFKHIYLYLALVYFVYILRKFVFHNGFRLDRLLQIGLTVVIVFTVSFGPFLPHIGQLLSRLFPFKRGLTHAYWAPNVWALYSFADRILVFALRRNSGSLTRGIVGDTAFAVLPDIPPMICFALTLASSVPAVVKLWRQPSSDKFILGLVVCGLNSYLFGWHVHEKAILMVLVPLCTIAGRRREYADLFLLLSIVGTYSLFPLLYRPTEWVLRMCIFLLGVMGAWVGLELVLGQKLLNRWYTKLVAIQLAATEVLVLVGMLHIRTDADGSRMSALGKFEFLPLMAVSVGCAVWILYIWAWSYRLLLK